MTEAIKLMRRVTAQLERNANILVMEAEAAATADAKSVMSLTYVRNSILGVMDKINYAEAVLATKPSEDIMENEHVKMALKFNGLTEEEKKRIIDEAREYSRHGMAVGRKGLKVTLDESAGQDEN